ncbi:Protein eyes shut, partial [Frankliniella fusca]
MAQRPAHMRRARGGGPRVGLGGGLQVLLAVGGALAALLLVQPPRAEAGFACLSSPCVYGICMDDLNSSFTCYCIDGYTGALCQTNWDECWSSPCLNGGSCVDGVASFNCTCPEGFVGELCELDVNECLSNPCLNNATCLDGPNGYACLCPPGYSGERCELDVAVCNATAEAPRCSNGGACQEGKGMDFSCVCLPGWTGTLCEDPVNECESSPCQHGGVCVDLHAGYACACLFGYTGRHCEQELEPCAKNSCLNGALCLLEDGEDVCYCVPDFHGDRCHLQYDECRRGPGCRNGGTCIDGVDDFSCSCPPGLSGSTCECVGDGDGLYNCSEAARPPPTTPPPTPPPTTTLSTLLTTTTTTTSSSRRPPGVTTTSEARTVTAAPEPGRSTSNAEVTSSTAAVSATTRRAPGLATRPGPTTRTPRPRPPLTSTQMYITSTADAELTTVVFTISGEGGSTTAGVLAGANASARTYAPDSSTAVDWTTLVTTPAGETSSAGRTPARPPWWTVGEVATETEPTPPPSSASTGEPAVGTTSSRGEDAAVTELVPRQSLATEGGAEVAATTRAREEDGGLSTTPGVSALPGPDEETSGTPFTPLVPAPTPAPAPATRDPKAYPAPPDASNTTAPAGTPHAQRGGVDTAAVDVTPVVTPTVTPRPHPDAPPGVTETVTRVVTHGATEGATLVYPASGFTGGGVTPRPVSPTTPSPALEEAETTAPLEGETPVFLWTTATPATPPEALPGTATTPGVTTVTAVATAETGDEEGTSTTETPGGNMTDCSEEPCLHGATCEDTPDGIKCLCAFGWSGPRCAQGVHVTSAAFAGHSFLVHRLPGDLGGVLGSRVAARARTLAPSGLLLHAALAPEIYMTLYLEDGLLKFQFSCGVQTMVFSEVQHRVNNGFDLHIAASLEVLPLRGAMRPCAASLHVNHSLAMSGEQQSVEPQGQVPGARGNRSAMLYLGGLPGLGHPLHPDHTDDAPLPGGLVGCMLGLEVSEYMGGLPGLGHPLHPDHTDDAPLPGGLVGCMLGLEVDDSARRIFEDALAGSEVAECAALACLSAPCQSGGTCVQDGEHWNCLCPS